MKYFVNEKCIGCGMCESVCPEVFHLEGGMAEAVNEEVDATVEQEAEQAMEGCPVCAIEQR